MNKTQSVRIGIFCLFMYTALNISAQSQEQEKWDFLTELYIMIPQMTGNIGINDFLVPIDANAGDIFENLSIGGMLYFEASKNKWAISSDLLFINLKEEIDPSERFPSGSVESNEIIWELSGLYKVFPFWELGVGGRLNSIGAELDITHDKKVPPSSEQVNESASAVWFDPLLVTRFSTSINDKWLFQLRGDLGGFGLGSQFTWQLQAYAGYRFKKLMQLSLGYKYLSIDYTKDKGSNEFVFDVDEHGPVFRVGFHW